MSQVDNTLFSSIVQTLFILILNFYGIFFSHFFDYFIIIYKIDGNVYLKLFKSIIFILNNIKTYLKYNNFKKL
jgi:hypothetical protein